MQEIILVKKYLIYIIRIIYLKAISYKIGKFYNYIYKTVFCVTEDEIPYNKRQPIIDGIKNNWEYYDILFLIKEIVICYNKTFYQDLTGIFN